MGSVDFVGKSCRSYEGTLGWRKGKWMKLRNETCSDIFKLKNVYI